MLNSFASHRTIMGSLPTSLFCCGPYTWLQLVFSQATWLLHLFLDFVSGLQAMRTRQEVSGGQLPLPPGSLGLPFIGEMIQFIIQSPTAEFFTLRLKSFGPIFKTHILFNPTIFISGPSAVRQVLLNEPTLVENRWPLPMRLLLGPGALATSLGKAHRDRRGTILRCLRGERLDAYLSRMRAAIEEELDGWGNGEVYGCAKRMGVRVAAEVLLGVEARELVEVERWVMEYAEGFFAVPLPIPGTACYRALRAKRKLHTLLRSSLQKKISNPSPCRHDDVISDILANSSAGTVSRDASVDHVIDQALELLFGGQETLSAFITCLVLLLAKNPHVIEQMSRELAENNLLLDDDDVGGINVTSLAKLTYFDYVIREVLRLYPPIGGGYRRVVKGFELQGFRIPINWSVTYSIKATHDSSPYFSGDTEAFRPERWAALLDRGTLPPEVGSPWRMRCDYLPFGAGARACVGQRYAVQFMRLFSVLLIRKMDKWGLVTSDPVMLIVPVIRPKGGLHVSFRRRAVCRDAER